MRPERQLARGSGALAAAALAALPPLLLASLLAAQVAVRAVRPAAHRNPQPKAKAKKAKNARRSGEVSDNEGQGL